MRLAVLTLGLSARCAACFLPLLLAGCATLSRSRNDNLPAPLAPIIPSKNVLEAVFTGRGISAIPQETHQVALEVTTLTLGQVLEIAQDKNPTFAQFEASREAARAEIIEALAFPNPELELGAGVGKAREGPGESVLELGLGFVQPIELPAKRRSRRAAAEAAGPIVEREEELFRVNLRADVIRAYHAVVFYEHATDLARELLGTQREIEQIVNRRVESGEAPEIDRIKAQVETRTASRTVQVQQRNLAAARAALNTLCGRGLPAHFVLVALLEAPLTGADVEKARAIALVQHPTVRRLEAIRLHKELVVQREQKAWYPDLQPGVGLGQGLNERTLGATVALILPLWYRNKGGIEAAKAELHRAQAELQRARQEVERDVETAAQMYESAREQVAAFSAGLRAAASESLRIETFLYQEGESDFLRLLDAQRTARQTEREYLQALYDAHISRAELERAIGIGGEKP